MDLAVRSTFCCLSFSFQSLKCSWCKLNLTGSSIPKRCPLRNRLPHLKSQIWGHRRHMMTSPIG